jgi:hypothetical protein
VIRNVAHNQRRADDRRARHERLGAESELSSESLADELATQKLVADALLRVDEPYRETLLRRWYRDEKPAAIARAMQVPVKTVETRLARGLERLRAELTTLRGGDRRSWVLALLPTAAQAEHAALATAGLAGVATAITTGVLAMGTTAKVAVAVGVTAIAISAWAGHRHWVVATTTAPERLVALEPAPAAAGALEPSVTEEPSPSRTKPEGRDPTVRPKKDVMAAWRKNGAIHGVVRSTETRLPIADARISAFVPGMGFSPALSETTSAADGTFSLDHLSETVRLTVQKSEFLATDRSFTADELRPPRCEEVVELLLEPRTYATLVARLVPVGSRPIDALLLRESKLILQPDNGDNDALQRFLGEGSASFSRTIESTGNGLFRFDRVPAKARIRASILLGSHVAGTLTVEPLVAGETREVSVPVDSGVVVEVRVVDANTRQPIESFPLDDFYTVRLRWTGEGEPSPPERFLRASELRGPLPLPGPGQLELDCRIRGFAAASVTTTVQNATIVEVPLVPLRRVKVLVTSKRGEAILAGRFDEYGEQGSSHLRIPEMPSFDALSVGGTDPLPPFLEPDSFDVTPPATLHDRSLSRNGAHLESADDEVHVWRIGVIELFAPREARRIGVYHDGVLAGSAQIGADDVEVAIAIEADEPSRGALHLRAIDAATRQPTTTYSIDFTRLVGDDHTVPAGHFVVEVTDPSGQFARARIPAGTYRAEIDWELSPMVVTRLPRWIGTIEVKPDESTELGTIELAPVGALDVRVVDETGAPVTGVEVTATSSGDGRPLPLYSRSELVQSLSTNRNGVVRRFNVSASSVRIDARAVGFEPAFAACAIHSSQPETCTIRLHHCTSTSHSSAGH